MEYLRLSSFVEASLSTRNVLASSFVALVTYLLYSLVADNKSIPGFEIAGKEPGEWTNAKARRRFMTNAKGVLENGFKQAKNNIFQVIAASGPELILPVRYLDEIRNHPHMDLKGLMKADFFTNYDAFSAMGIGEKGNVVTNMVNRKLTTSLVLITAPVNEETNIALQNFFPPTKEWTPTQFGTRAQDVISQVSSRIFLGVPLCRNPEWIKIAKDFTVELMLATYSMRYTPSILRPLLYYFLPPVNKLKRTIKVAKAIIEPEVKERRRLRNEALARGEVLPKTLDAIEWMDDVARDDGIKDFDTVEGQLGLSLAAIATTSSTVNHLMYDIIDNPELIPELRKEIIAVMEEGQGWQKTSLYKLKLLDSVMKESQRINALGVVTMTRIVHKESTLSDGTVLPKGVRFSVPSLHMTDPEYWPNPNTFDGKRFLKLRELPGNTNKFQFATTTADHIGFGHGKHACPGRFFASNELKIMICHLIMKYDWKFKENKRPETLGVFNERIADPMAELLYKSRVSEVDF
ncbi:putative cytochrome p450 protein [Venturia nashicola]|uniref:Putative cytochrome p450 protein n=1 Tax=Venturia nashicola TaxID=86259 RepID=A0A4Z1P0U7_9PEZI|nr:putative cytochrome p450 protein [Venturia nashicola]TLD21010.1 putative cytochrome p450 protein [Venturia nashicola]